MRVASHDKLLKRIELFGQGIKKRSPQVQAFETPEQKRKRKEELLANFEKFCKFYFPKIAKSEFAKWHKKYYKHVINHDECFCAIKVARDMAKSSVTVMLIIFLYLNGEIKSLGYFSHSEKQATMLLAPVKAALTKNHLLIRDFGKFKGTKWKDDWFVTKDGCSFMAFGAGQSPRGGKDAEESNRYDTLIFDDFDNTEVCLNEERLDKNWKYVQGDVLPALHVSGKKRVIFLNNKIAEDCIIERADKKAKDPAILNALRLTVNLRDANGRSNWSAYTDEQVANMYALAGEEAETEYDNNPTLDGKQWTEEDFIYRKLPPLSHYTYMLSYLDGGFKKGKNSDTKALGLWAFHQGEYHLRWLRCRNANMPEQVDWHYYLDEFLRSQGVTCPMYMEEVFVTSLLYNDFDAARKARGYGPHIIGDTRQKQDKDMRIAGTLGKFRAKKVIIDERLKDDPDWLAMKRQYIKFRINGKYKKDGPDMAEGAFWILDGMIRAEAPPATGKKRRRNRI